MRNFESVYIFSQFRIKEVFIFIRYALITSPEIDEI